MRRWHAIPRVVRRPHPTCRGCGKFVIPPGVRLKGGIWWHGRCYELAAKIREDIETRAKARKPDATLRQNGGDPQPLS